METNCANMLRGQNFKTKAKKIAIKISAAAFWILIWEVTSRFINSELIICSPLTALRRLIELLGERDFYKALAFSSLRILTGFFSALILGTLLAALSAKFPLMKALLEPITSVIKATPVASFIILALIWFGSRNLSMFISFLMVFPVIYLNILEGIEALDPSLSEMGKVFKMGKLKKLIYIDFLQLLPFICSACSVALGLCWKSGVAAEVIGISTGSVGERLYRAKLYFETGDLLAWTAVIIAVSAIFEKLFMSAIRFIEKKAVGIGK